ncbi:MAG: rRNA pseudouridine synthase [Phycisphaerales bacterium]|nr:rRNA pseudouridine synthase [Phycisphaerales bacterium]
MTFSKKKSNRLIPAEFRDAERGIRLQKAMAEAGTASRRDCEKMIEQGRVTVNGQPVAGLPAWVDPFHDRIELDGKALRKPKALPSAHPSRVISSHSKNNPAHSLNTLPGDKVYVMLHKPRQTITTTDDPDKRRNVMDLVPVHELPGSPRLFPVGRLDADSTGLLLLTNDGELANRLTHPRYGIRKTYLVSIKGRIEHEHIEQLKRGLFLAQRSDEGRMTTDPVGHRD